MRSYLPPLFVLAIATSLLGCRTTRTLHRPFDPCQLDGINSEARGRELELVLRAAPSPEAQAAGEKGRETLARPSYSLKLGLDQVTWEDQAGFSHAVPTMAVKEVRYLSPGQPRLRGVLTGAGLGFLTGAAGGAVIGLSRGSDPNPGVLFDLTAGAKAVFYGALLGTLGTVVGGIFGGAIGEQTVIEIEP